MKNIKCIDVSKHQGVIDWDAVRGDGVEYAIIRVAYRGWGKAGTLQLDPMAEPNIAEAKRVGIKVGYYCFSQATTKEEALEEADTLISIADIWGVDLPLYIDSEWGNSTHTGRADKLTPKTRTDLLNVAMNEIKTAGYKAGLYGSTWWLNNMVGDVNYDTKWVAHYADACAYRGGYDVWQYSSTERVEGINTYVDANKIIHIDNILTKPSGLQEISVLPKNKTKYKEFAEICHELQVPIYLKLSSGDFAKISKLKPDFE